MHLLSLKADKRNGEKLSLAAIGNALLFRQLVTRFKSEGQKKREEEEEEEEEEEREREREVYILGKEDSF